MIENKFLATINEYRMFEPGDTVLVAVSGGADSTALLNLLHAHRQELNISLQVAHLNHLLRKSEAELDLKYVEGLAQKLKLPISKESVDVATLARREKLSVEAAARLARYDFFEKIAAQAGASKIAVGHSADDNIETFLMRLLRGAGLKGLGGIPPRRGKIVRPLIKIWRREIEDYIGSLKLVPRRDHTNYESKYVRNSVRNKLVPQLKIYNLNIKEIILQTILLLTEDNLYLENTAAALLSQISFSKNTQEIKIDLNKLRNLERSIARYVLRLAVEQIKGNLLELSFKHLYAILDKLAETEKWELHLPDGIYVTADKNWLVISREKPKVKESTPFKYLLPVPGEVSLEEVGGRLRADFVEKIDKTSPATTAFVDYAVLGKEVVVRNKLAGDRFCPLGIKGTKKLQDFFIDEKIPAEEREQIPILESAGNIIWVAGRRLDERAKVTENTQKIVKLELL
jgi:tRNA(Ile)-lysidine synthase